MSFKYDLFLKYTFKAILWYILKNLNLRQTDSFILKVTKLSPDIN